MSERVADIAGLPDNQLTLICRHVFLGERQAAYVEPTEEGILVLSCGEEDHTDGPEDWLSAGFGAAAARDPSLRACPPIRLGRAAERQDPDAPWEITEVSP
ncbi:MAG: hypothetical protein ACFBRM_13845 [Pikeienuella sp.]